MGLEALLIKRDLATAMLKSYAEHLSEAQRIAKIRSWELSVQENKLTWSGKVYRLQNTN